MKLLIVSGAYPPMAYGEAPNTHSLARRLARAGIEVHVLTRAIADAPEDPGVFVHPVVKGWTWARMPQLRRLLEQINPDAILLMYVGAIYDVHPMITFLPTVARRILPGVRVVTRFENPLSQAEPGRYSLISRLCRRLLAYRYGPQGVHYSSGTLLRDSDAVVALCRHHLALLRDQDPSIADKATMMPPPANVDVISDIDGTLRDRGRKHLGCGEECFLVGYLGYAYQNKGIETLLRAIALLGQRGRAVRLVVLGGPIAPSWPGDARGVAYYEGVRRLADDLGLKDCVVWNGPFREVDRHIAGLIHAVDAFVLPFDNGVHLNNSSVAALASYGKPIVTTRRAHTDEQFVHGSNALLLEPGDPVAIANAIDDLIGDPGRARQLASGALALAEQWFSWDAAVDTTIRLLEPGHASAQEGSSAGSRSRLPAGSQVVDWR